jgi:hypothetical protein
MQKLIVNPKGGTPKVVHVLRSWVNTPGPSVYLFHGTGIYGYADGSPVKSAEDLNVIASAAQRAVALKWWEGRGKALSEKFYAEKEAEESARAGDFQDKGLAATELDYVMYESRPATGKNRAWSAPFSWVDKFSARPDWWGQASGIAFKDMEYRRADAVVPDDAAISAGEI